MSSDGTIVVQVARRFDAQCERVFDAWLDPETIGRWMFGANVRDEDVVHLHTQVRVGGDFSFLVRRQGESIDHVGTYLEIERPRRLVFTWAIKDDSGDAPSEVAIDLAACEDGCDLKLTHTMDRKWAAYADRTRAGWTTMLDALARQLAGGENEAGNA